MKKHYILAVIAIIAVVAGIIVNFKSITISEIRFFPKPFLIKEVKVTMYDSEKKDYHEPYLHIVDTDKYYDEVQEIHAALNSVKLRKKLINNLGAVVAEEHIRVNVRGLSEQDFMLYIDGDELVVERGEEAQAYNILDGEITLDMLLAG